MPRPDTQSFNKEKLFFLLASGAFALLLFWLLASAPQTVSEDKPRTNAPLPRPLQKLAELPRDPEDSYVLGPNRQRKNPFSMPQDYRQKKPVDTTGTRVPPPPPPPSDQKPKEPSKKNFDAKELDVQVAFMGVVMRGDEVYALVKPKDGSSPRRVKVGDTIPDFNYTVTRIDKQAIWMEDDQKRPFILGDDEEVSAVNSDTPAPKAPSNKPEPKENPAPQPLPKAHGQPSPTGAPEHPKTRPEKPRRPRSEKGASRMS